ncbi:MAG: heavy metal-binding domain-containing protein [Streptosporangiaceae bacterium]
MSGTWGSALTADEFAAVRSVGFEPVGQVFGAAVYGVGPAGYSCPGPGRVAGDSDPGPPRPATQVSGRSEPGSFGPLVQARYQARDTAIDRMTTECRELGGHGVVGVRLSRGSFLAGGAQFTATGTAVRAPGAAVGGSPVPFTSDVSGQDFAKLVMRGWMPAGLALGISIGSRHDDRGTARQTRWVSGNAEVAGWTELVGESRRDARRQLEGDLARLGAEGVVIATMELRVRERDCPGQVGRRDHIVEATLIGTAITRFSRTGPVQAGPGSAGSAMTIMSLDPQRRQAARIRI